MQTSLWGIAEKAKRMPKHRFGNLYGLLNEEMLKDCWRDIRKDAALGVDRVSAAEYEQNLDENIRRLVERLKSKTYRARLVRRHYIPKGEGKMRPLGILVVEDKLLQIAVTRILTAIYEVDFLPCSYGYRPMVGVKDAVKQLTIKLQFGRYNWIVESDVRSYFDSISHQWLMRMLEERIDDRAFLRLIGKWLRAGVLETDGRILRPEAGTQQGGSVSAILANVYLHYVLDLWFEKRFKQSCKGRAFLIRYADDWVCGFEYREDAERFFTEQGERLQKFELELSAEKTQVLSFYRLAPAGSEEDVGKESIDFLGFEYRWGKDRKGKPHLERRTSRKRYRRALQRFTEWCKKTRDMKNKEKFAKLKEKLTGYYNHYGLPGNLESLQDFFYQARRILFKWSNRRSQKRSYTWKGFEKLLDHQELPQPRITDRKRARTPGLMMAYALGGSECV
jgi:group II intron reverse transcriptase/maturase